MTVYLGFLDHVKHSQQIIEKPTFMSKHKISINNPVQTHYTVQGVQSYAPQQLKAIKQREDRLMQGKQGTYISPKVVLLSDQIIQFDERDPLQPSAKQKAKDKEKQKEIEKEKGRVQSAKNRKVRTNSRNAVSANNQTIVKLEKQVAKRNSLQRKLQKMSQKYKQYFKDVDLKEGLKTKNQKQKQEQQQCISENQVSNSQVSEKQGEGPNKEDDNTTQDKSQTYRPTQKGNKKSKQNHAPKSSHTAGRQKKITGTIEQDKQEQQSENQSRNVSFDLGLDLVMRSTTYSEKLGSAIHQMFK